MKKELLQRMNMHQVMEIVNTTPNPTREQLLAVTTSIRRLMSSDKNAPIQQVLDNGLAQMLLNILVQVDECVLCLLSRCVMCFHLLQQCNSLRDVVGTDEHTIRR